MRALSSHLTSLQQSWVSYTRHLSSRNKLRRSKLSRTILHHTHPLFSNRCGQCSNSSSSSSSSSSNSSSGVSNSSIAEPACCNLNRLWQTPAQIPSCSKTQLSSLTCHGRLECYTLQASLQLPLSR